jgi:hypothetical protein
VRDYDPDSDAAPAAERRSVIAGGVLLVVGILAVAWALLMRR